MKYIKGHYVDAKTGRSAAERPMVNGPALPSDKISIDAVDRRPSPTLVIGTLPDAEEVPSSFEKITEEDHAELLKSYNDWRDAYEQRQLELRAAQERDQRDLRLADTDWVVVYHTEKGIAIPYEWKAYRQALRDVPQQAGFPNDIEWPEKPEA